MKLLVTGGAGFIGSNFIHYWLKKYPRDSIVNLDKLTYASSKESLRDIEKNKNYTFIKGDIGDARGVSRAMKGIDVVVSFAAESHVDRSILSPADFIMTNVVGTQVLLDAGLKHQMKRFHHISSVTGDTPILLRDKKSNRVQLKDISWLDGKEIENFEVLTINKKYKLKFKSIKHFIKHWTNEIYKIKFTGGGIVRTTGSHSVFVFEKEGIKAKPVSQLKAGDFLITFAAKPISTGRRLHIFDFRKLLRNIPIHRKIEEGITKKARILVQLKKGRKRYQELSTVLGYNCFTSLRFLARDDAVVQNSPYYRLTEFGRRELKNGLLEIKWKMIKNRWHLKSDSLKVSPLLMKVFGLYLAEGHCSHTPKELGRYNRSIVFTIGKNDKEKLKLLKKCAQEVLGIKPYIKERESSFQIQYTSYWVHNIFSQFGVTAADKRIPSWLWNQPKKLIKAFLEGYEGDASIKKNGVRIYTSLSKRLLEEIAWLCRLNGINCRISSRIVKQIKGKRPPGVTVTRKRKFYDLAISADFYNPDKVKNWRTPESFCLPTEFVREVLGFRKKGGVDLGDKPLVGKRKVKELLRLMGKKESRSSFLLDLVSSALGVARTKSVEKVKIGCMVYDVSVPGNEKFFGGNIPCLLHNTDEVFGALPLKSKKKFTEKTVYNPRNPYSASKAAADHLVRAYHTTYGLPITITNCSNNFGPYQDPEKFLPRAITNLIDGEKIPIYGDGKYVRDWLYVEDHCRAIDMVLHKGKIGETYLVGGLTRDINNLEVAKKLLKIFGKDKSFIRFVKDRPGHDRRYAVDWSKIKREIGWKPKYDFDTWLEKTVKWYQNNEWWWRPLKRRAEALYKKTGQK